MASAVDFTQVLAGIAGEDGLPDLVWFAPEGSAAPTDAATALDAAFLSPGVCGSDGFTLTPDTSSTDIGGFGVLGPVRTITTSEKTTGKVVMLQSNLVSLAVYHRMPLVGTGAPTVDTTTGEIATTDGVARTQRYAFAQTAVDGLNLIRTYCPSVEVTARDAFQIGAAKEVSYGVALTCYPDATGLSVYQWTVVDALKSGV